MHIAVIGLSFFVSVSTVYGNSTFNNDSNQIKKTDNIVSSKINPRIIVDVAGSINAPVDINEEDLQNAEYSYTSNMAFSDNSVVDSTSNRTEAGSTRQGLVNYTVQGGETLSTIASKFNVTTNTVKWANGISDVDSIKPGQSLVILPVAGTMHRVQEGDTLAKIASTYNASGPQIIEENGLVNDTVEPGKILIIPGGSKWEPAPQPAPQIAKTTPSSSSKTAPVNKAGKRVGYGSSIGGFPYGYCTYYVASRRAVTWRGNAGAWLGNAAAQGYATGRSPQAGAIVVTSESPVGHVALVESVNGGSITISEMNYAGRGVISRRTISAGSGVIKGFIY